MTLLALAGVLLAAPAPAQPGAAAPGRADVAAWNGERVRLQAMGMKALGAWGTSNLVLGTGLWLAEEGEFRHFGAMSAGWGAVNLAIAGASLAGLRGRDPARIGLAEGLRRAHGLEKTLLFNAGLDVGYVMAGGWMREVGLRDDDDRLAGYGTSIMAQGAFLFVFDTVLWYLVRRQRLSLVERPEAPRTAAAAWLPRLAMTPAGLSLAWQW